MSDIRAGAKRIAEQAAAKLDARYATVAVSTHLASYRGFFGTVLGLSVGLFQAFGGAGTIALKSFGSAVATRFDTTLSGMACTILLIMAQSLVRSREESVLAATDQVFEDLVLSRERDVAGALGVQGDSIAPQNFAELFRRAVEMIARQVGDVAASSAALVRQTGALVEAVSGSTAQLGKIGAKLEQTQGPVEAVRSVVAGERARSVAAVTEQSARKITGRNPQRACQRREGG